MYYFTNVANKIKELRIPHPHPQLTLTPGSASGYIEEVVLLNGAIHRVYNNLVEATAKPTITTPATTTTAAAASTTATATATDTATGIGAGTATMASPAPAPAPRDPVRPRVRFHFLDAFALGLPRRKEMPQLGDGMHWSCGTARSADTCRQQLVRGADAPDEVGWATVQMMMLKVCAFFYFYFYCYDIGIFK